MRVKKETLSYLILGIIITISSLLIGCNKNVLEEEKQVYAWPIATASPEDTVTQIFAEKFAEVADADKKYNEKQKHIILTPKKS